MKNYQKHPKPYINHSKSFKTHFYELLFFEHTSGIFDIIKCLLIQCVLEICLRRKMRKEVLQIFTGRICVWIFMRPVSFKKTSRIFVFFQQTCFSSLMIIIDDHHWWSSLMIINDEKACLMKKHENHRNFFSKGNGPHKNPYANPSSENLKHRPAHMLPETDSEKQFYEKTCS